MYWTLMVAFNCQSPVIQKKTWNISAGRDEKLTILCDLTGSLCTVVNFLSPDDYNHLSHASETGKLLILSITMYNCQ